ncbi:hypothetical protein HYE82_10070 [Streptomyces sp. BR123]|uniref:hypothetical protein n=1 Tax=Streptomyces sp. BR123 TaxID=2749828 RepID=UPI0015C4943C|nr:hypothetical protein [Streptomyces sp. BR123]NXY94731.1 hypothetical protein [Streptomyces sp. BR123]
MIRRTVPVAALAAAACLCALAGCGTTRAGADIGVGASASASGSASATPDGVKAAEATAAAERQQHEKQFPEIAAHCADAVTATPSRGPSAPQDPEGAKYAENHVYKSKGRLSARAECAGRAHAARITQAFTRAGNTAPTTGPALKKALDELGYPTTEAEINAPGLILEFAFMVKGTGACVSGTLAIPGQPGTVTRVEAHGPYMEGGCVEPRGGH